jgi:hypothetical protein
MEAAAVTWGAFAMFAERKTEAGRWKYGLLVVLYKHT